MDAENLRGLRRYYNLASELGLIDGVKEIVLASEPVHSEQPAALQAGRHR
jgi:hypothetical protein